MTGYCHTCGHYRPLVGSEHICEECHRSYIEQYQANQAKRRRLQVWSDFEDEQAWDPGDMLGWVQKLEQAQKLADDEFDWKAHGVTWVKREES
jgi:hypothetical protein